MVDVISGGRLILGVGAGYAPEEFAAFGVSLKERGSRLDEAVPLIQRLWSEDNVTHEGRHYRITNATVSPRPVQRPPLWSAGWVEPAIRRAGRLGDAWLGGPSAMLDELAACVRLFREARTAAGREDGDVALIRYVFVAETAERARAIAGPAFIRAFEETYFRWPHPVVTRPAGDLTIERLSQNRIILGDPASCLRQIRRFQDAREARSCLSLNLAADPLVLLRVRYSPHGQTSAEAARPRTTRQARRPTDAIARASADSRA